MGSFSAYSGLGFDQGRFALVKDMSPDTPLTEPVIEQMKDFVITLEGLRRALGCGGGWLEHIPELVARERMADVAKKHVQVEDEVSTRSDRPAAAGATELAY